MITKHIFGLIECYTEQGVCYYNEFGFNPGFLLILKLGLLCVVITSLYVSYLFFKQLLEGEKHD